MGKRAGILGVVIVAATAIVGASIAWRVGGAVDRAVFTPVHVAPGVVPVRTPADATRITLAYLDAQRSELAAPELHIAPSIGEIWAVTADQAAGLDGCIPTGKGNEIVWVTKGHGDYLNLADHPWSSLRPGPGDPQGACAYPAPNGTIVIDDATGDILGVYPDSGSFAPHPSPKVPAPAG